MKNFKWFTLTELIIGITISAVVLLAVLGFISNVMSDFGKTRKKTEFITTLYDFTAKVNEYTALYDNSSIINTVNWHDVLFLYNTGSTGVIFWIVNDSGSLDSVANAWIYDSKLIGYKELTATQVNDTILDSNEVYWYSFFGDKIFHDMYMKSFEMISFNSWALVNLDLEILVYYKPDLIGQDFDTLTATDVFQLSLTF